MFMKQPLEAGKNHSDGSDVYVINQQKTVYRIDVAALTIRKPKKIPKVPKNRKNQVQMPPNSQKPKKQHGVSTQV